MFSITVLKLAHIITTMKISEWETIFFTFVNLLKCEKVPLKQNEQYNDLNLFKFMTTDYILFLFNHRITSNKPAGR